MSTCHDPREKQAGIDVCNHGIKGELRLHLYEACERSLLTLLVHILDYNLEIRVLGIVRVIVHVCDMVSIALEVNESEPSAFHLTEPSDAVFPKQVACLALHVGQVNFRRYSEARQVWRLNLKQAFLHPVRHKGVNSCLV